MKRLPDKAIRDLAEGGLLKGCDILLMHTKRSPRAWLIQHGTNSYWNHALMVNITEDDKGICRTLIIDPKMSGLKVDEVAYYLNRPDRYDVGVKRLEQEWFQNQGESLRCTDRVLQLALTKVAENRDSGKFWRPVLKALRQMTLPLHSLVQRVGKAKQPTDSTTKAKKPMDVTAYTCSGFVQWCYYHAVRALVEGNAMEKRRIEETIFSRRLDAEADDYSLLSTTPSELARSAKLSWKYVVKDGKVWEVSSEEEANRVCKSGRHEWARKKSPMQIWTGRY